jgi:hypothetical protein
MTTSSAVLAGELQSGLARLDRHDSRARELPKVLFTGPAHVTVPDKSITMLSRDQTVSGRESMRTSDEHVAVAGSAAVLSAMRGCSAGRLLALTWVYRCCWNISTGPGFRALFENRDES